MVIGTGLAVDVGDNGHEDGLGEFELRSVVGILFYFSLFLEACC